MQSPGETKVADFHVIVIPYQHIPAWQAAKVTAVFAQSMSQLSAVLLSSCRVSNVEKKGGWLDIHTLLPGLYE